MNKIIKSISIVFLSLLFITFSYINVFGNDNNYDYVINNYDVSVSVNENNILYISENIAAFFNVDKHGIVREIPETNVVYRLDGTSTKAKVKVSNINVDNDFEVDNSGGIVSIKIGNANEYVNGDWSCHITYNYDLRNDVNKGYDELYLNIIGNSWDTKIENVTFSIAMPKDFDESKLGFSSGEYGTLNSDDISYVVEDNVIYGKLNRTLNPYEALTVRLELEDGYFDVNSFKVDPPFILSLIVPILSFVVSLLLWKKYGKDDQVVETVEFYPPNGYNSLDVAFAYKGSANQNDVISLLVYLANKGYIRIIEKKKDKFTIEKIKEYDGTNDFERKFFSGLFKNRRNVVDDEDLIDDFYETIDDITLKINNKNNREKIYHSSSLFMSGLPIILLIILTYVSIVIKPSLMFGYISSFFDFIFPFEAFGFEKAYLYVYIYGIVCIIAMMVVQRYMPKRTEYGNKILGKIRGFKNFLNVAEKDKLEAMVNDNPNYFYDILPYAYVLGVSSKWIKKFEKIKIEKPDWYQSYYAFNMVKFDRFMNSTMNNIYTNVQNSGGGVNTGGGFSGGGFGGGGGHSW